jgi:hypothetical protein
LHGLVLHYLNKVDLQITHQLAEELLRLAHAQADPVPRMLAHHLLGMTLFYWGEPVAAHTHHLQSLPLYRPREHQAFALRYGFDLGVGSHNFLAWELWHLGYPDQAMQHSQAAHTLAQEVSHPYSLCLVLVNAARLHQHRRETLAVFEQAKALMTLATEQGFAQWLTWSTILHGWALAM